MKEGAGADKKKRNEEEGKIIKRIESMRLNGLRHVSRALSVRPMVSFDLTGETKLRKKIVF